MVKKNILASDIRIERCGQTEESARAEFSKMSALSCVSVG